MMNAAFCSAEAGRLRVWAGVIMLRRYYIQSVMLRLPEYLYLANNPLLLRQNVMPRQAQHDVLLLYEQDALPAQAGLALARQNKGRVRGHANATVPLIAVEFAFCGVHPEAVEIAKFTVVALPIAIEAHLPMAGTR